ncbi:type II toxin-antitoxin system Phd/YefM family antitoxin [Candidatus Palauibacter sp.]|uniref:type II toxin-antitoxin system Phd/YefM family antitoxin n=1 Tax=Candidatus Palauibacter sp. TaxID=3101350 RepID=UPI003B02802D
MPRIGAVEARNHLPRLLHRVQAGERFVITRHGRPVAELIPFGASDLNTDPDTVQAAIDDLKGFQRTHSLGGLSVRKLIEAGRH